MSRFDSRSNLTKLDSLEYLAGSRKYNVYLRPSYACDRRNETDGGWKRWDGFSGSFVRRPTLHVAYLRNTGGHARRHRSLRTHLEPILTSNRIGSTLDFPYSRWNFASRSLFLSPSLSPRGSDLPARSESRCAEKEDLSRRDVVLTSVSRRRGPRDLDNRSRRARQGRVTVRRMKVTRIIHGPVFLFSKIERWSQESTGYYRRAEIGKGLGNSKRRPAKRAAGLSSSGLGDTVRKKVLARHKASTNIIRVFENGWKDSRVFLFWPCSSKRCTVSVEEREGGGEERRWHFDEDRIVSQESHFSRRNSGGITHDKRTFTGWRGRGKGYRRYTASLLSARILVGRKTAFLLERASPMLLPRLLKTHSLSVLTLLACATCSSQFATWTRYTNRRFTGKLVSKFLKRESESFDERFCYTARILIKLTSGNSFSVPTLRVHSLSDPEFLCYNSDTNIW